MAHNYKTNSSYSVTVGLRCWGNFCESAELENNLSKLSRPQVLQPCGFFIACPQSSGGFFLLTAMTQHKRFCSVSKQTAYGLPKAQNSAFSGAARWVALPDKS
jgi:hypothetical protein